MPGDTGRYQIDYILMNSRYWNSVTNAKTYPGADIDSDHSPVVASLRVKLKKVLKAKLNKQWNLDKVKDALCATDYRCEVDSHVEKASQEHKDLETIDGRHSE